MSQLRFVSVFCSYIIQYAETFMYYIVSCYDAYIHIYIFLLYLMCCGVMLLLLIIYIYIYIHYNCSRLILSMMW